MKPRETARSNNNAVRGSFFLALSAGLLLACPSCRSNSAPHPVEISEVTLGELFPAANPTSLLEAPDAAAADPSTEKLAKDAVRDHCGFHMPVLHAHKVWQGETFIFRDDAAVDLFVAVVVDRNRTRLRLCQIPQW